MLSLLYYEVDARIIDICAASSLSRFAGHSRAPDGEAEAAGLFTTGRRGDASRDRRR